MNRNVKKIIVTTAIWLLLIYGAAMTARPLRAVMGESDAFCHKMQQAIIDECGIAYENRLYDGGDTNYPREDHVRDIPLCDRMGTNLYNACKTGEYSRPKEE